MKSIFLCQSEENIHKNFTVSQVQDLSFEAGLFPQVFSYEDLLRDPSYFSHVEFVFSTWGMPSLSSEEIASCLPSLKAVFYAAGSVQAFARPFLSRGVRIFSAWSANAVPVAEYATAQILLANKGFFQSSRLSRSPEGRSRAFNFFASFPGNYNCSVGILGAGQIGRRIIHLLQKNYHLSVKVFDPFYPDSAAAADGVTKCDLNEIFSSCQTISNHLANNADTQGILHYNLFSKMKPNATFINTGRGAQVVEPDLIQALQEVPTRTAILDVTYPEPPNADSPLYSLPNVFLTPHIAGSFGNETHRMSQLMIDEFRRISHSPSAPSPTEVSLEMLQTMA